jgi:hypothetical protein
LNNIKVVHPHGVNKNIKKNVKVNEERNLNKIRNINILQNVFPITLLIVFLKEIQNSDKDLENLIDVFMLKHENEINISKKFLKDRSIKIDNNEKKIIDYSNLLYKKKNVEDQAVKNISMFIKFYEDNYKFAYWMIAFTSKKIYGMAIKTFDKKRKKYIWSRIINFTNKIIYRKFKPDTIGYIINDVDILNNKDVIIETEEMFNLSLQNNMLYNFNVVSEDVKKFQDVVNNIFKRYSYNNKELKNYIDNIFSNNKQIKSLELSQLLSLIFIVCLKKLDTLNEEYIYKEYNNLYILLKDMFYNLFRKRENFEDDRNLFVHTVSLHKPYKLQRIYL